MTTHTTYKFRAECHLDTLVIRMLLQPWVIYWQEASVVLHEPHGTIVAIPDVDVTFALHSSAPTLAEIRWIMSKVDDLHVPMQSIELAEHYTGRRNRACEVLRIQSPEKIAHIVTALEMPYKQIGKTLVELATHL